VAVHFNLNGQQAKPLHLKRDPIIATNLIMDNDLSTDIGGGFAEKGAI
jgi:hypothetical protein